MENYFTEVKNVNKVHYELDFDENEDKVEENKDNEEKGDENGNEDLIAQENGENKEEKKDQELKRRVVLENVEATKTKSKAGKVVDEEEEKKEKEEEAEGKEEEKEKDSIKSFDANKDVTSALTANRILDRDSQGRGSCCVL